MGRPRSGSYIHEHTTTVATCTRPVQDEAHHPSIRGEGGVQLALSFSVSGEKIAGGEGITILSGEAIGLCSSK